MSLKLKKIRKLDPHRELIENLPRWFARDLNAAIEQDDKLSRLVLFFDTHEAFWGHQRDVPEDTFFYMDEWLRRLLNELKRELGIVVVVAGREEPRWIKATKFKIPKKDLHTDKIGHLSKADAEVYLQKAGVGDADLIKVLIDYAIASAAPVRT